MIATPVSIRRTMNLGGFLRRNLTGCSPKRFIMIHPRINTHQHMLESAKVVFVHDTIPIRVRRKCTVDSQSTVGSGMISLCAPTLSWRDLTQRNSMRLQQPCDWSAFFCKEFCLEIKGPCLFCICLAKLQRALGKVCGEASNGCFPSHNPF